LPIPALAAKIKVSPTSSPPGSEVIVNGQGFGRNEEITIFFESTELVTIAANSGGNIQKTQLLIPSNALPGLHAIKAVGQESGLSAQADVNVNTNWTQYGFDAMHSGFNWKENVLSSANVSTLEFTGFSYNSRASILAPPVIVDNMMYIGTSLGPTNESALQAVDNKGKLVWLSKIKGGSICGLAFSEGKLIAVSTDGYIRVYRARNGRLIWGKRAVGALESGEASISSPAVSAGNIYVTANSIEVWPIKLITVTSYGR
jgi:hypothetical protein